MAQVSRLLGITRFIVVPRWGAIYFPPRKRTVKR